MLATAYAYPDEPTMEQMEEYARYFNSVKHMLPCPKCRKHYAEMIEAHPVEPHLGNGDSLRKWIVARKNDVNERLGKPCPTTGHICRMWEQKLFLKKYRKKERIIWCVAFVLTILLVGGLFFWFGLVYAKAQSDGKSNKSSSQKSSGSSNGRDRNGKRVPTQSSYGRRGRRRDFETMSPPLPLEGSTESV